MADRHFATSLSGFVGSESEGESYHDGGMMLTPDSENVAPTKRARGRPKASARNVTKGEAPSQQANERGPVVSIKSTNASRKPRTTKREVLWKQETHHLASDTEGYNDTHGQGESVVQRPLSGDELEESLMKVQPKRGRPSKLKPDPTVQRHATTSSKQHGKQLGDTGRPNASRALPAEKSRHERTAEAQPDEPASLEELQLEEPTPRPLKSFKGKQTISTSQIRQPSLTRRRAGSASDTERSGNDPATRRKLGELTKKFENLDLKYRNLREVGVKESEVNFDRLRNQVDAKTKATNELIVSLKRELAAQTALAREARSLRQELAQGEAVQNKANIEITSLNMALSEAQSENRTLSAKLAATRNTKSTIQSSESRVLGSAAKPNGGRTVMIGSAEAAQAAQMAALKEDLYGDLTGLILRNVKKEDNADVYDCLQTGRNGTLHFKLAIDNDSTESFEQTECHYTPLIDESRDKALIELLPDYLTEEITFPREKAGMFYSRVVQTLTKEAK